MSGGRERIVGRLLPVIVIAVGAYFLLTGKANGTLSAARLRPVNWAGLALMAAGVAGAFFRKPLIKLIGVLVCGIGAILVICL